jgi:hypothetical protein
MKGIPVAVSLYSNLLEVIYACYREISEAGSSPGIPTDLPSILQVCWGYLKKNFYHVFLKLLWELKTQSDANSISRFWIMPILNQPELNMKGKHQK